MAALVDVYGAAGDPLALYLTAELDKAQMAMLSENVAAGALLAENNVKPPS